MLRHVHVLLATKWILRKEGKISMLEQQQEIQQQCNNISNNRKYHTTRRLNTRKLFDFYVQYSYMHSLLATRWVLFPVCLFTTALQCLSSKKCKCCTTSDPFMSTWRLLYHFIDGCLWPLIPLLSKQATYMWVPISLCGLCGTNPPENHHQSAPLFHLSSRDPVEVVVVAIPGL